jgi:hypothetical protein
MLLFNNYDKEKEKNNIFWTKNIGVVTFIVTTFSIMTLSIMRLSIRTFSITINKTRYSA